MNCKPRDIAIIVSDMHGGLYLGKMVEVISAAPPNIHKLPNGVMHEPSGPGRWLIKSLGGPFPGAMGDGMYGCARDCALRPIRGELTKEESAQTASA